jgi:hypothetical protein
MSNFIDDNLDCSERLFFYFKGKIETAEVFFFVNRLVERLLEIQHAITVKRRLLIKLVVRRK